MNRTELGARTRSMLRDFSGAVFRPSDVDAYINEGIDRFKQVIPEFEKMEYLPDGLSIPVMIPTAYQHLLSLYSASRCFGQDDRHYQSSTYMNEFETKLHELKAKIESGKVVIIDPDTNLPVVMPYVEDYVRDNYFMKRNGLVDVDKGVDGL